MKTTIDVLGLGYTAVDELLYFDGYPQADSKMAVRRRERHCGGLAATALVAAARLGCRCGYAGTLGDDDHSRFVIERFGEEGVSVTHLRRLPEARPVRSTILVDQTRQTRTILFDTSGVVCVDADWPPEEVIRGTRVLLVDNCGVEGMIRAARIAREAGIPVVADFENADDPLFPQLLGLANHLILSCDFALKVSGQRDPALAVQALWAAGRRAVVVTCGKEGCWYASDNEPTIGYHQPALAVEVVDTTGCGDVFHGAYAAALVRGQAVPDAVRFASVAAGLKATGPGGQAGIPTLAAVEQRAAKEYSQRPGDRGERVVQKV
ncbi:MAG: PfkB family carbohydrate kinase [Thermoguttaceae bacterium]|jgi:sugar/nucleoside kinase (ribokinase family)